MREGLSEHRPEGVREAAHWHISVENEETARRLAGGRLMGKVAEEKVRWRSQPRLGPWILFHM